jgi:hypothetical protein
MHKTLEELKAENAALEAEAAEETATEAEEDESVADEEIDETEGDAAEQAEGESKSKSEDWMKEVDGEASEGSDQKVPVSAIAKVRGKFRAKLEERDGEIERLRMEVEQLKKTPAMQSAPVAIKRPTLEECDFDEEKHALALDQYYEAKFDAKLQQREQSQSAKSTGEAVKKQLDEALDDHYLRVERFCETNSIAPEEYRAADAKLRQAVEQVMPKRGDAVTDYLLANLGEDSDKVSFFLGRNAPARAELQRLLMSDPNGISAAVWLGKKAKELSSPVKLKSTAPKPSAQMSSDAKKGDPLKSWKDKINKARKADDMQEVMNLRFAAKKAGVDIRTL